MEKVDAKPTGNTEMETIHGLPDHPYEIPKDDPAAAMSKVTGRNGISVGAPRAADSGNFKLVSSKGVQRFRVCFVLWC